MSATVLHNVEDRRSGFIGSWLIAPLDYEKLSPFDIGRTVIYRDGHKRIEAGTLASWRDGMVFVRFTRGDTAAATLPADLVFGIAQPRSP
jgi:hypothetical protein